MNRPILILCFALLAVPCAANPIGLLPEAKNGITVPSGERNPYAKRGPSTATTVVEDTESEESRLRSILSSLSVTGASEGPRGRSVLLGSTLLREGQTVPPLMENQTEILRVLSIDNQKVELVFVEKENRSQHRSITLFFDLAPEVRYMLSTQPAQPRGKGGNSSPPAGVISKRPPSDEIPAQNPE